MTSEKVQLELQKAIKIELNKEENKTCADCSAKVKLFFLFIFSKSLSFFRAKMGIHEFRCVFMHRLCGYKVSYLLISSSFFILYTKVITEAWGRM
jgi:hypothetical protein